MKAANIQSFISINAVAYAAASKVFAAIDSQDFSQTLAEAGILPQDVRTFAVIWVAKLLKVTPTEGQRGLGFKKDSPAANKVKYLVSVVNGKAAGRAAKRGKVSNKAVPLTRAQKAAVAALVALFGGDTKAARAAIV
jgi:hypothetical protein